MDISKELEKLNENPEESSNVLAKVQKEYENMEKKLHIFDMIDIAQKIKQLRPQLLEAGITTLRASRRIREDGFGLELAPENDPIDGVKRVEVRDSKNNFLPWFNSLMSIYMYISLNCKLTQEFQIKDKYNPQHINLREEIEPQIYKILLTKELQTLLEYTQLHLKLEKNSKRKPVKEIKPSKI